MPAHGQGTAPQVPLLKRAAILSLHWYAHMSYRKIESELGVSKSTVESIIKRAKARSSNPEDFDDVLACLDSESGGGNSERFPNGSEESLALRDLSQKDEEHWLKTFPEIANELGIVAARSTLEKVFHQQHNIFRRKAAHKPSLSESHIEARLAFAHMALQIAVNTIVFRDEMWVEFGKPRRQRNISRYRGIDSNEYAIHDKDGEKQPIRVMFWGAIILGTKGPYHVWEQDTAEDQQRYQQIVEDENQRNHHQEEFNCQQALIQGTWQQQTVLEINQNIEVTNYIEGRTGRNKRRKRRAEQIFKEKELGFTSKGGINWVSYRERVLRPKLYPWMKSMKESLRVPHLYLVEDNAPCHQTARIIDKEERQTQGIVTLDWPSKSPDLNQIERIWDYEKDEVSTWKFIGGGREAVEGAKNALIRTWEDLPQAVIDRECEAFHEKLQRVILHTGNNNFNG